MGEAECVERAKDYMDTGLIQRDEKLYREYIATYYFIAAGRFPRAQENLRCYLEDYKHYLGKNDRNNLAQLINALKIVAIAKDLQFLLFSADSPLTTKFLEEWVRQRKAKGGMGKRIAKSYERDMKKLFRERFPHPPKIAELLFDYANHPEFILDARKLLRK